MWRRGRRVGDVSKDGERFQFGEGVHRRLGWARLMGGALPQNRWAGTRRGLVNGTVDMGGGRIKRRYMGVDMAVFRGRARSTYPCSALGKVSLRVVIYHPSYGL